MNILFLTLLDFCSIDEQNIYTDLLREFYKNGHSVYAISPLERKKNKKTVLLTTEKAIILKLKIGNTQKTNVIEKGLSMVSIEPQFIWSIRKYFSDIKFDIVIYSTPPITFCNVVEYVKCRDNAKTYLLLKDIFPQNAVDVGMLSKSGLKGILYKIFRRKEKRLYAISDRIGCMSQANVDYVLQHNSEISKTKVEVCPNCIEVIDKSIDEETRIQIRKKYQIPLNKRVFIYGGNLGKPQGVDYIIDCIKTQKYNKKVFFLIVGDGTEYKKLEKFSKECDQENFLLMKRLPKDDYDTMVAACDIGMIFLDYRFTIPNFPSRLLSYMQAKLPVLAVTDKNTDIGKIITEGGFGWWCESNNKQSFENILSILSDDALIEYKVNAFTELKRLYSADLAYKIIERYMYYENN